ncbi:DOMON-like domain-containing protein [Calothrix sp. UHCC 0171]|uniref:DOMON-like domain-containing protein n=1 Tax=Calothrix sp. UHCC 0171 TaxID=3110245 RepID=UPI002B1E94F0|nr:DOMON-like domain-containing protein [Calothrix sp. UHCC 0171]MEA5573588.1 DOMON-like domain-containing protein [Calothrix sp. UHCC 0171]
MEHLFTLQPFPTLETLPNITIIGNINQNDNLLNIRYALRGNITEVEIPFQSQIPQRKNELWEHTCFEFFIGVKNSPRYWEFNLSPSRDWNVYSFEGYRQGMQSEAALSMLPFRIQNSADCLELALSFDLDKIIPPKQDLEVGVTAVIKCKNSQVSYWALTHCAVEADFHQRDSFLLDLKTF